MRQGPKQAKTEVQAKRPATRVGATVPKLKAQAGPLTAQVAPKRSAREPEKPLAGSLEQQKAISEILRVMSSSPGDVKPVLDVVAERAAFLCEAPFARVSLVDGDVMRPGAEYSIDGTLQPRTVPLRLKRSSILGRAVLDRRTVHHDDVVPLLETEYPDAVNARRLGLRAVLAVPLMREDNAYGAVFLFRRVPRPFSQEQVALVETFAQQAAIAIDNARLFRETKEALEQQTAISEILRVIASSPGDVRPMLSAVVESAAKLCEAANATIFLVEGDSYRITARFGDAKRERERALELGQCIPLTRGSAAGRAIIDRTTIHLEDLAVAPEEEYPMARQWQRIVGHRTLLAVPLLREDRAIGAISLFRMEVRPFTDKQISLVKTFADQAAIAIQNVRLFDEVQARTRELSESLHQQTATADVLKVISRSAFDLQNVLDTLTKSAHELCDADGAAIWRPGGDGFKAAAMFGQTPEHKAAVKQLVIKPGRDTCAGRALLEGRTVHIRDSRADPEYNVPDVLNVAGNRAMIGVPLLREGAPIGVLVLTRTVVQPFTEQQIALATTFADQAVIAIENVRLFNETKEALEQQTATSEILRVISGSPTDVQPVFHAIVQNAARLCDADFSCAARFDGGLLHPLAYHSFSPRAREIMERSFPMPPNRGLVLGRAAMMRTIVNVPDTLADPEYSRDIALAGGWRSALGIPMLRDGDLIGAIAVSRRQAGAFPDHLVALVQTFADQAVIAIENVRLFNETKEALERQTATSEILRVISRSPTDVQPVFDAIAPAALKLCGAAQANVFTFDGRLIHVAALAYADPHSIDALRGVFPRPPSRDTAVGRAVLTRSVVAIPDVLEDPEYKIQAAALASGFRSALAIPLIRAGKPIGAIALGRPEPGLYPDKQITLLQTFADQAVIAIENVRLFTELEARTRELTRSVGELKALGEVGQAVSSTLDLETVLSTIVSRAAQLAGMDGGSIWEYDETREEFHLRATDRLPDKLVEVLRAAPIRKGEGALGRLAITSEPVQIRDIADERTYQSRLRQVTIRSGFRSVLAVPLLREDHLLGALAVNRASPGDFAPEVIDLLKTFATQSALAIQNARLFREIEYKSRELEIASQHKSEFLANMSHELRTPLNAIIGFSEVLSERMFGEINEKQAEYIGDILQSGQHLLSLINDILDLSKIEAGRMELEFSDFNLPSTIEQTVMLVRERAVRRRITLGGAIDERLGSIRADERKVKQVLLNLLSNALKFTPEGGKIDVRAAVNDGVAEISVTDTGVGISPEDQEAVFEEFRQVGTASKKVEGTGLGLAISRKFVELHGGKIWVKSQVGSGSTFVFTLPLQ
jgi:GAF domain-containing protein